MGGSEGVFGGGGADLDLGGERAGESSGKKLVSHAGIIFVVNLRQKHNERLVNLVSPPPSLSAGDIHTLQRGWSNFCKCFFLA